MVLALLVSSFFGNSSFNSDWARLCGSKSLFLYDIDVLRWPDILASDFCRFKY